MREEPDAGVQPGPTVGAKHDDSGRGPGGGGQLWPDLGTDGGIPGRGQH